MRLILILLVISSVSCFAQTDSSPVVRDSVKASSMFIPDMLSTHPLGIFMSRISHNFQTESTKRASVAFHISSGNVWLPYVKGYLPQDESDKAAMKKLEWYDREYNFDTLNSPSETLELHADGVFRSYQVRISIPLSKSWELTAKLRAFSVDPGNIPFSTLTSDKFIEWFHSNVKGGEDPFARKFYGLNKTNVSYTDQNGRTLYLKNGDFVFSGIEFSGSYYPQIGSLIKRDIFLNLGFMAGINTSRVNPSIDLGLNSAINKQISLGRKSNLQVGASGGIIRQNSAALGEGVQISNKKYLFTSEFLLGYSLTTGRGNQLSVGSTYFLQSTYNERSDFYSMVLTGNRVSTHWHYALSHLYRRLTYNTLFISYSKGFFSVSGYIKEDFFVDNAPDAQTGVAVRFNLKYQIRQDRL